MKDILIKKMGILDFAVGSPRETLQQAFTNGIRLSQPYTTKSISLVGVAVPVAKEPNKSRRFTLFFLQIMVTFSMISEIGITFMIHSCPPLLGKF